MPFGRFIGIGIVLVVLSTVLGAGFVAANQAVTTGPSSTTTVTITIFQNRVTTITQTVTSQETNTQTVTQTVMQPTTQTQVTQTTTTTQTTSASTLRIGTIEIYWQVANYTLAPVSSGIQPVYLGSHYDMYIPMHVMDWYTVSCGTPYSIAGTLYWYNYSMSGPYYYGVGNLEVYANATYDAMITGTQILSFASGGTGNVTFTSLFTAC
ncbi:MAG: hypothetical protein M1368_08630 [Thaumarchaeota archaeon]|nr:hypothetical protein [Nitrososphaerota archaeon]